MAGQPFIENARRSGARTLEAILAARYPEQTFVVGVGELDAPERDASTPAGNRQIEMGIFRKKPSLLDRWLWMHRATLHVDTHGRFCRGLWLRASHRSEPYYCSRVRGNKLTVWSWK